MERGKNIEKGAEQAVTNNVTNNNIMVILGGNALQEESKVLDQQQSISDTKGIADLSKLLNGWNEIWKYVEEKHLERLSKLIKERKENELCKDLNLIDWWVETCLKKDEKQNAEKKDLNFEQKIKCIRLVLEDLTSLEVDYEKMKLRAIEGEVLFQEREINKLEKKIRDLKKKLEDGKAKLVEEFVENHKKMRWNKIDEKNDEEAWEKIERLDKKILEDKVLSEEELENITLYCERLVDLEWQQKELLQELQTAIEVPSKK